MNLWLTKLVSKIAHTLVFLYVSLYGLHAQAWTNITILTTNNTASVKEFVVDLRANLLKDQPNLKVNAIESQSGLTLNIPKDTLVIAVGTQALQYASHLDETTPVIGALVPQHSYQTILKDSERNPDDFSAIYLDQPFVRQFSLIKSIQPNLTELGVLIGPVSQFQSNEIQSAAKKFNIKVNLRLIQQADELQANLEDLLRMKTTLLAVPDPLIYTRDTAQTILLTTYRHHSPVIGFSQSYVKSGAIAAVFTTPKQYAIEMATLIKSLPKDHLKLPEARPADTYSVEINRQVAKSLGIKIGNESTIYEQMKDME